MPDSSLAKEIGIDLAESVTQKINAIPGGQEVIDGFVERMNLEHRTLQQGFTRLVVAWLEALVKVGEKGQGHYDGRNAASVEFALSIKEQLEKAALPFV